MKQLLSISNISVSVETTPILNGLSLSLDAGQVHAIMGPNGSGKSTLAATLMGHPKYTVTGGQITLGDSPLLELSPDKRAKLGLFLGFQYPLEIEGIDFLDFLRQSYNALHGGTAKQLGLRAFRQHVAEKMKLLDISEDFLKRGLNVGFSGGEKKRAEILQLAVLEPKVIILDEIDSGLDIDALRLVAKGINQIKATNPQASILIITHYNRILDYVTPDVVHVMDKGAIVKSGDAGLAKELETVGYKS